MLQIRDADTVFEAAIRSGVLTRDEESPRCVDAYMYMSSRIVSTGGTPTQEPQRWWRDGFKHRDTRRYIINLTPAD